MYIEFSVYLPLAYADKRSPCPNYDITTENVIMKFSSIGLLLAGVAGVANVRFTSFPSLVYFSVLRRTNLRYDTLRFLVTPSSVLVINAVSKVENVWEYAILIGDIETKFARLALLVFSTAY